MTVLGFERERLLADALSDGVVALSDTGRLNWWNASAERLLGLRPEHHQKEIMRLLKGTGIRTLFSNHIESLSIVRKVRRKTWHLTLSLREYRAGGQLLIVQDTTELEGFVNMRKDFIANVSHELRTPLTVFRGYLELIQDGAITDLGHDSPVLQQMNDQCHRMESLVKGLLLLSRLESNGPDLSMHQLFSPGALLESIVRDAKQVSQGRHTFKCDIDNSLSLMGEVNEIQSTFSNLIMNAVRYTPGRGDIKVSWKKEKDCAVFSVSDTGIGISAKHIDKLTQRFYRVDQARSQASGGTGLGLAIVKHVLVRHDAELVITSEPNKGSTFSCRFPLDNKDE